MFCVSSTGLGDQSNETQSSSGFCNPSQSVRAITSWLQHAKHIVLGPPRNFYLTSTVVQTHQTPIQVTMLRINVTTMFNGSFT